MMSDLCVLDEGQISDLNGVGLAADTRDVRESRNLHRPKRQEVIPSENAVVAAFDPLGERAEVDCYNVPRGGRNTHPGEEKRSESSDEADVLNGPSRPGFPIKGNNNRNGKNRNRRGKGKWVPVQPEVSPEGESDEEFINDLRTNPKPVTPLPKRKAKMKRDKENRAIAKANRTVIPKKELFKINEKLGNNQDQLVYIDRRLMRYNPILLQQGIECRDLNPIHVDEGVMMNGTISLYKENVKEAHQCILNFPIKPLRAGQVVEYSSLGGLIVVLKRGKIKDGKPIPVEDGFMYKDEWYPIVGGTKDIVRGVALGLVSQVFNGYVHDMVKLTAMLAGRYKQSFRAYPFLIRHCEEVLNEPWVLNQATVMLQARAEGYNERAHVRFASYCSFRGMDVDKELERIENRVRNLINWRWLRLCEYTTFCQNHGGTLCNPTNQFKISTIVYREALAECEHSMPLDLLFVPCAKVLLTKSNSYPHKLPPVADDVSLSWDGCEVKHGDEDVDCFGLFTDVDMIIPRNNNETVYNALRHRMAKKVTFDKATMKRFTRFSKNLLRDKFGGKIQVETAVTRQQFFDYCQPRYGESKTLRLWKLRGEPLTGKDAVATLIMKTEAYFKDDDSLRERMIWSRSEKFLSKFLVHFARVGCELKKIMNVNSNVYYAAGGTPWEWGSFADKLYGHICESDVSGWDGSMNNLMLKLELWFTKNVVEGLPDNEDWQFLFKNWDNVSGQSKDGSVKYSARRGRRSGDPWTSMYNSLIHYCVAAFVADELKMEMHHLMMNGDDGVVSYSVPINVEAITRVYQAIGMKVTVIPRTSMDEATFCSGIFWKMHRGYKWGNLGFKQLSKTGVNYNKHPAHLHQSLLHGTAKGLLPTCGHIPIIGEIYRALARSAEEMNIAPRKESRGMNPTRCQGGTVDYPDNETYDQFSAMYGIPVCIILMMEEYIRDHVHICNSPMRVEGSIIDTGVSIDLGRARKLVSNAGLHGQAAEDHISDLAIEVIPFQEELEKMSIARKTGRNLLEVAREFGEEEVALGGNPLAPQLHMLFSSMSHIDLNLGTSVHRAWNHMCRDMALVQNGNQPPLLRPCAKKVIKKKRPKSRKPFMPEESKGGDLDKYYIANVAPFAEEAIGAKIPDWYNYPSGAYAVKETFTLTADANGQAAVAFSPEPRRMRVDPFSITAGEILWHDSGAAVLTGCSQSGPEYYTLCRTVAAGLRFSTEENEDNVSGRIWMANLPDMLADTVDAVEHNVLYYPNNVAEFQLAHTKTDLLHSELLKKGYFTVPFPFLDVGAQLYQRKGRLNDGQHADALDRANRHTSGQSIWVIMIDGFLESTSIEIEWISHQEVIMNATNPSYFPVGPAKPHKPALSMAVAEFHSKVRPTFGKPSTSTVVNRSLKDIGLSALQVTGDLVLRSAKAVGRAAIPFLEEAGAALMLGLL
jgi:hypothetical protein